MGFFPSKQQKEDGSTTWTIVRQRPVHRIQARLGINTKTQLLSKLKDVKARVMPNGMLANAVLMSTRPRTRPLFPVNLRNLTSVWFGVRLQGHMATLDPSELNSTKIFLQLPWASELGL